MCYYVTHVYFIKQAFQNKLQCASLQQVSSKFVGFTPKMYACVCVCVCCETLLLVLKIYTVHLLFIVFKKFNKNMKKQFVDELMLF